MDNARMKDEGTRYFTNMCKWNKKKKKRERGEKIARAMKKRKRKRERKRHRQSEWNNVQKIEEYDESKAAVLNLLLTLLFFLLQSVHLFRYNISRVAIDFTRGIVLWCIARTSLRRRRGKEKEVWVSGGERQERREKNERLHYFYIELHLVW